MTPPGDKPTWLARFPNAGRVLTVACIALAAWLLTQQLRDVEWASVGTALRAFTPFSLAVAFALAVASHVLYASYELIGRHLTQHGVPRLRTLTIGAVSYAFNLNLGTLIGGFATRYRLYANAGLDIPQTTQVIGVSVVTNWFGYCALAGTVLTAWPPALPPHWVLDGAQLRGLGLAMLALAGTYLAACTLAPNRRWEWRGHALTTPSARVALLQGLLSTLNWATIATLVWWVLGRPLEWPAVAAVFLLAAVAGVVVRVPAGLGVLEAVFLALLAHRVPAAQLLAGLIVHRVVYYFVPLTVGAALMLWLERDHRRSARDQPVSAAREPRSRAASP
jgi:glycosyltransferase 2 family protein